MKYQRGAIMIYGALAAGAVILALGIALKVQSSRLNHCHSEKAKVEAAYALLADKVEVQNKAIEGWEKSSKEAQGRARIALQRAKAQGKGLAQEIEGLRLKLKQGGKTCSQAISDIKQELMR